ncbi:MAG: hypothetical protein RL329_1145 [Bacteroidota bacterium]|jgi:hypothetical protein
MIRIPYGLANYNEVRTDKCFYLDRTEYIELLETYGTRYAMFLRPRRFGKSLFISILEHYYDVNKAADFPLLFGDLYIGKHPTPLANQFMILRFDFSGIETNEIKYVHDSFLMKVKEGFRNLMSTYPKLFTEAQHKSILNQSLASGVAVDFFGFYNENKIQRAIYILIDEYDQFTNELLSFHFQDFKEIVSQNGYVRKFYEVLKTEAGRGTIARIFMTGVAPVTVDSMTSGFNITTDLSLYPRFHNMMGFTEVEVVDLLQKIDVPAPELEVVLADLRQWYDGYRFHPKVLGHLYNPEMVLYFANYYQSEREYPPRMLTANFATDYQKIANIFNIGGNEDIALAHLNDLLENGAVHTYLTDRFNVAMGFGIQDIWSMLFYTGMTTIQSLSGNEWTFQMPNYVIKKLYYDYFVALSVGMDYNNLTHLIRESLRKLVWQGNIHDFVKYVERALSKAHSNRDKITYGEKHLKTLMIGLLYPYESYHIRSELEINSKYVDIFLERIPQVVIKHEVLFELKYIKKEDASKWVDKDGKVVEPPAASPAKKGRKPKTATPVPTPAIPANSPVKSLLDHVSEKGAEQLADYMKSDYFKRPNLLAYCLVFVGSECKKILPYGQHTSV